MSSHFPIEDNSNFTTSTQARSISFDWDLTSTKFPSAVKDLVMPVEKNNQTKKRTKTKITKQKIEQKNH